MGILVPECVLPSGIQLSNVYMSFNSEIVYVTQNPAVNNYIVQAKYSVYKNETKDLETNIKIPLVIQVNDINVGVYASLYENLKQIYPNSVDC